MFNKVFSGAILFIFTHCAFAQWSILDFEVEEQLVWIEKAIETHSRHTSGEHEYTLNCAIERAHRTDGYSICGNHGFIRCRIVVSEDAHSNKPNKHTTCMRDDGTWHRREQNYEQVAVQ